MKETLIILLIVIHGILVRFVGALLVIAGLVGHVINYNFDYWAGRGSDSYLWGWAQWSFFGFCWLLIAWGGIVQGYYNDLYKEWKEDEREQRKEK